MNDFWQKNQLPLLKKRAFKVFLKYRPAVVLIVGNKHKRSLQKFCLEILKERFEVQSRTVRNELDVVLALVGLFEGINSRQDFFRAIFRSYDLIWFRRQYPNVLIFEIEPEKRGEVKKIFEMLEVDVLMVTDFDFPTLELELRKTVSLLKKKSIFIAPEEIIESEGKKLEKGVRTISLFGKKKSFYISQAEVRSIDFFEEGKSVNQGVLFQLHYDQNVMPFRLPQILSLRHAKAMVFALALGITFKLNMVLVAEALKKVKPPVGEMVPSKGIKETLIVNDSREPKEKLLESLEEIKSLIVPGKKIALLSAVIDFEKGRTGPLQRKIAETLNNIFDVVILFGDNVSFIESELLRKGFSKEKIRHFEEEEKEKMIETLKNKIIKPKDLIFLRLEGKIKNEILEEL